MINKKTAPKCLLSKISQNRNGAVVFVIFVYCISVYWHWTSARSYNTERCALLQVKHNSFMCWSKSRQKCDLKSSELNLISIPSTKYMTMFRWYHKISMLFWCITFSLWVFSFVFVSIFEILLCSLHCARSSDYILRNWLCNVMRESVPQWDYYIRK